MLLRGGSSPLPDKQLEIFRLMVAKLCGLFRLGGVLGCCVGGSFWGPSFTGCVSDSLAAFRTDVSFLASLLLGSARSGCTRLAPALDFAQGGNGAVNGSSLMFQLRDDLTYFCHYSNLLET